MAICSTIVHHKLSKALHTVWNTGRNDNFLGRAARTPRAKRAQATGCMQQVACRANDCRLMVPWVPLASNGFGWLRNPSESFGIPWNASHEIFLLNRMASESLGIRRMASESLGIPRNASNEIFLTKTNGLGIPRNPSAPRDSEGFRGHLF